MICPKCKSTEVHAEKRGWSLLTGFIGSGKIVLTCLDCGKQFKPGEQHEAAPEGVGKAITVVLIFIAALVIWYANAR